MKASTVTLARSSGVVANMRNAAHVVKRWFELSAYGVLASLNARIAHDSTSPRIRERPAQLADRAEPSVDDTVLRCDNPDLVALFDRYRSKTDFLRIVSPMWEEIPKTQDLRNFRSHGAYLWTRESDLRYKVTAYCVC